MQIELLFRIAGVGVLTWAIGSVLHQGGRDELATLAAIAGLSISMLMVLDVVSGLLDSVKTIFQLY